MKQVVKSFDPMDAEKLAMDLVAFLRKWGMWNEVQIFTGGKCYSDDLGKLKIRKEKHPEKYTKGIVALDCNAEAKWMDFSNPERLLDMTFEGPLWTLFRHHEYEVQIGDVSDEVKHLLVQEIDDYQENVTELMAEFLDGTFSWDPAEFDSYEEWLALSQYSDIGEILSEDYGTKDKKIDFSSREEYEDFLMRNAVEREFIIEEYFEEDIYTRRDWSKETFHDSDKIASLVLSEFDDLLAKYGLWYDLGFSWSLTTYRKQEGN